MDNLARIRPTTPVHEAGTVLHVESGSFLVRSASGEFPCRRAVSCLVEPSVGDKVLMFADPTDACWVLAVLEREAGTPTELVVEGDARIVSREGSVTVSAPLGVRLDSEAHVSLTAPRFRLVTRSAELVAKSVMALGETLDVDIKGVKLFARTLDRFVDHVVDRCRTVTRIVDDSETVRAARIDLKAEQLMVVRGENTVMTAQDIVKVDGKQIHMG